jgi:hypothetical protein
VRLLALLLPACILVTPGCFRETPVRVEDRNLGIIVQFPGQPRLHKFSEPTPFGAMEWFSTTYDSPGRLDRSFFINVGNLPPGSQGGSTETEVLATLRKFLTKRMGKLEVMDLAAARGPGFRYKTQLFNGEYVEGLAIVRRGRIHQAQATVSKADDPALRAFLDSFEVLP